MLASFFSSLSPHPDENNIFIFVRMRGETGNKAGTCSHNSESWLLQGVFFSGSQVEGLDLSPVLSAEEAPVVVHGTLPEIVGTDQSTGMDGDILPRYPEFYKSSILIVHYYPEFYKSSILIVHY